MMRDIKAIARSVLTSSGSQNFLGAGWIPAALKAAPRKLQPWFALRLLSISPHYFYGPPEIEAERNRKSREQIARDVIAQFVTPSSIVLDYGCGPGYLAKAVAPMARWVDAVDISKGVTACANVLNAARNISYLTVDEFKRERAECATYDLSYSFAVVQHVTDAVFQEILCGIYNRLKPGGRIAIHIVIDDINWRTEAEWKNDLSLRGRLKLRHGLNCFRRNKNDVKHLVSNAGFLDVRIEPLSLLTAVDDDVARQHLITATRTLS